MQKVLHITVRLLDDRYHGNDNVPSPARLFQALVAGAGLSGPLSQESVAAMSWLEALKPPIVATPWITKGQPCQLWVPNNDLDAKGGDLRRISEIRAGKQIVPKLFDNSTPFLYSWRFQAEDEPFAKSICLLCEKIYQFGRGVDLAWAYGDILSPHQFQKQLETHRGPIYQPTEIGKSKHTLTCPSKGSLESLQKKYAALKSRFAPSSAESKTIQTFSRQPKPLFLEVAYNSPPRRLLYEVQSNGRTSSSETRAKWPLESAYSLVRNVRDAVITKLTISMDPADPFRLIVDQVLVGRRPNGENSAPRAQRLRLYPLASIGHEKSDLDLRRILVEVPTGCPINIADIDWAFSGVHFGRQSDASEFMLAPSAEQRFHRHFGTSEAFRVWRTLTPVALPLATKPTNRSTGSNRSQTELALQKSMQQALRHAEVFSEVQSIKIQKEPFDRRGRHAHEFAAGTRFESRRLWHVELAFAKPQLGMLALGDGRFAGLGVFAPSKQSSFPEISALKIESEVHPNIDPILFARAFRRALLSRIQATIGQGNPIPSYFSGHQADSEPLEDAPHIAIQYDPRHHRFLVFAPECGSPTATLNRRKVLADALLGFHLLKTGRDGILQLQPYTAVSEDRICTRSKRWSSLTPYRVNRHRRVGDAELALARDVEKSCLDCGLPKPSVKILKLLCRGSRGLEGLLNITFPTAIQGPLMLGKTRFLGGGLFVAEEEVATSHQ